MQKILAGLLAVVMLALAVGAATDWFIAAVICLVFVALPVLAVFVRLKLSPHYRAKTNATLTKILGE